MAPRTPVERISSDSEDTLPPVVSTSLASSNSTSRRPNQTARKSTGGLPPRKMLGIESSRSSRSSSPGPNGQSRTARKSTGGIPSRPGASPQTTMEASLESLKMPIRSTPQSFRKSPLPHRRQATDSDETGRSQAGSSDPSSSDGRRTSRTARKSTGGVMPRKRLEESAESSSSAPNPPPPVISAHDPAPIIPCDFCRSPLQIAYSIIDPSQPIHDLLTTCQHRFHYPCYLRYLTTAPINSRACCPKCQANLLTDGRYWVHVTTTSGAQCYTDITTDVKERFEAVRLARQQILLDFLSFRNLNFAATLLTGPDSVDINFRTPNGGWTPLHFCAMRNDVAGIDFLLSHGADKQQTAEDGLLAIDYAKSYNALNAVERLS